MPKTSKKFSQSKSKTRTKEEPAREISQESERITLEQLPSRWLDDLKLLRRVIGRTKHINDPRMDLLSQKDSEKLHEFKIATISTNLETSQLSETNEEDYRIWTVNESQRKQLRKDFLKYLKQAAEAGAKLICFNELAYPTPLDEKGDVGFRDEIAKLVIKHNLSLIAGSYHDTTRFYNLSPVVACDAEHQTKVFEHAKMTSAVKAFEFIRIPPNRRLRYYQTEHGFFAVLICIDVYDPSLIFRLVMKNHLYSTEEKIDLVFVPSFTPTGAPGLAHACQDLSYAAATLVVYVNCSANKPRHMVYLGGEEVTKGNETVKCKVKRVSDNVQVLSITHEQYQRMRQRVSDGYSPIFDFLIGLKPGIRHDVGQ